LAHALAIAEEISALRDFAPFRVQALGKDPQKSPLPRRRFEHSSRHVRREDIDDLLGQGVRGHDDIAREVVLLRDEPAARFGGIAQKALCPHGRQLARQNRYRASKLKLERDDCRCRYVHLCRQRPLGQTGTLAQAHKRITGQLSYRCGKAKDKTQPGHDPLERDQLSTTGFDSTDCRDRQCSALGEVHWVNPRVFRTARRSEIEITQFGTFQLTDRLFHRVLISCARFRPLGTQAQSPLTRIGPTGALRS